MSRVSDVDDISVTLCDLFAGEFSLDEGAACEVIRYATWKPLRTASVVADIRQCPETDIVIVLLDCGEFAPGKRLAAHVLRKLVVKQVGRVLRRASFNELDVYGIYPDVHNIRIVYQQDSAAARYAHSHLISVSRNKLVRLLNQAITAVMGRSFQVDAVAVIGRRQSCEV